jgi:hypothetical protein
MLIDYEKVVDHSRRKLGKLQQRKDRRTLDLRKYLDLKMLPPTPISYSWDDPKVTDWGMMGNDNAGDCVEACGGHQIQVWTDATGAMRRPTDTQIIADYTAMSGYNPATGANDNGTVIIDYLNYWRNTGLSSGDKILAYTAVMAWMQDHIKKSIFLFGGVCVGAGLPIDAQTQNVWDVSLSTDFNGSGAPGSWGGHCFTIIGYNQEFVAIITWGALKAVSWRWFIAYITEIYPVINMDFILNGKTPSGFNLALLQSDLNLIGK